MVSFFIAIILGSVLLSLPISSASGVSVPYIDALFTATTSVCVTGLVTVTTATAYSTFGHIIILCLIQIGGLGVLTAVFGVVFVMHKKLGLQNRLLLQDALNLNTTSDIATFVLRMIKWTLIVEGIGALFYMIVFIPEFGAKGVWYGIFHAVSAFCNAGIDILGENSLCDYSGNTIVNLTTCGLVVFSSIGYIVWFDVSNNLKRRREKAFRIKNLSLHSKIVLLMSACLVFGGALVIFLYEYNNPQTMGGMGLWEKMLASLFQSVTCRTAGFVTIPQENFTNASALISMILMFIGGSPVSTAGGVKTVTFVVLIAASLSTLRNQAETELFHRTIRKQSVNRSVSVVVVSLFIILFSTLGLSTCIDADFLDLLFETVSACATVGITRGITGCLNTAGKIVIICTMFLGRVGPISLAIAFNTNKEHKNVIKKPEEEVYIG